MKKECEVASWWWTSQLNLTAPPVLTSEQVMKFQKGLARILEQRYLDHWYSEQPERGHAYRSIWFAKQNGIVDNILIKAAREANINNIKDRLQTDVIMWCDPGLVVVCYHNSSNKHHVIYEGSNTTTFPNPMEICRPKLAQLENLNNKQRTA